ncbi:lytic transglycosylase domain-containing protein [Kineosporia sp. R_H_3]|uniref:lytic transglycosylase domain-containing protein n=1 Tax=Kineosporia sp. R_H_3 TaxID=1961848 RepID=UPI0018E95402|nr:lytic transglycosylase domain-containing protein [Kineosporia sp. R_H_3]
MTLRAGVRPALVAVLLAVSLGVLLPAAPGGAAPAAARVPAATGASDEVPGTATSTTKVARLDARARAARARARAAARQVDTLTARYEERSRAAADAADRLAAAFTISAGVDRTRDADAVHLRSTQVAHAARIRALYTDGGAALAVTVLGAPDLDEAMWRISTLDRIEGDLARRSALDLSTAGARAARSAAAARAAAEADDRLAVALRAVQDDASAAEEALGRARTVLDRLDAEARGAEAAKEAAARLAAAQEAARLRRLAASGATGALGIPVEFERLYRAAAPSCPGMDWTLLAAVGQVESGHGRNNGPSSAGAIGPMQFMPATFASYAVDGDRDGDVDAWDPADAVWTAARYLCASGAEGGSDDGVRDALFAYNHAQWYVDLVLGARQAIADRASATA